MAVTIVSGFNPEGFREYGGRFIETFCKHWPSDVRIIVYTEEPIDKRYKKDRFEERSLWVIKGVREFIESHSDPIYHGKAPVPGWNKKDERNGSSYRYDVVRFCRQLFIPAHAAESLPDGDILVWFDADVLTYEDVPAGFIEKVLGNYDLVTIGRDRNHTDIGFWAIRLGPETRELLNDIANSYRNGYVLKLAEWHSAYLFDHWKDRYIQNQRIRHLSLTNGSGHVWFQCEIGRYTDHLKGELRKKLGYSPERHGVNTKQLRHILTTPPLGKPSGY
jgi:hypothetical protein